VEGRSRTNFEFHVWVFDSVNFLSCSTILWFRASVLMWARAEKPNSCRDAVYCGNESNILKASSDCCGYDSRTVHQNRKNSISWKISCADESFRKSQNWSCTSSRILATVREVKNRFRKNASSSSLSSEKYHWNSISRDWRWSIIDVFKFLASSSVFSTTLDNFSNKQRFLHYFMHVCNLSF